MGEEKKLQLETVLKGNVASSLNGQNSVIKSQSEWELFLQSANANFGPYSAFDLDFNSNMVIAAFMSTGRKGIYDLEISEAIERANAIDIYIKEKAGVTVAIERTFGRPYHLVKIKKSDKEIGFIYVQNA